jgi:histidyl-tRNA synthetase
MKQKILSVKGTRDFYPEQMRIRTWLYRTMKQVSESFGYEEYEGPFLEYIDLYAAKSGDELVKEQAFTFQDRGGDWITLRPELTPTLARMVAQKQNQLAFPLRWWSFGPMWRYERPQKGRSREFFQWNIDMIGAESPEVDAELVAVGATFLKKVGMHSSDVQILVNNRRLVDEELKALQIPAEMHSAVFKLIDRRDKMKPEAWHIFAQEIGLSSAQFEGIVKLLADDTLWQKSEELVRFFKAVEAYGVGDYVRYAPEIIRGLDYYTGTVFEARDRNGEFRAILGGGRYDNLVSDVGGEPLTGVGFAMGDVVISLVLNKYIHIPNVDELTSIPVFVTVFDESLLLPSLCLTTELRKKGINAACYPQAIGLPKQLKYADRIGARVVIIMGPDEQEAGMVTIKDLKEHAQQKVIIAEMAKTVHEILAQTKGL